MPPHRYITILFKIYEISKLFCLFNTSALKKRKKLVCHYFNACCWTKLQCFTVLHNDKTFGIKIYLLFKISHFFSNERLEQTSEITWNAFFPLLFLEGEKLVYWRIKITNLCISCYAHYLLFKVCFYFAENIFNQKVTLHV